VNANLPPADSNRAARITLLCVGIFTLVLFVFLGVILWRNPVVTTLRCSRENNLCMFTQIRRNRAQNWPVALDSLSEAHVVYPKRGNRGRGVGGYEVYIRGTRGDYYFAIYDTLSAATSVAGSFNAFLANGAQSGLFIVRDESSMNALAWILMIAMPVFIIGALVFAWRKLPP
jgi:hypothetical protein